jgi:hypothetical protein
MEEGFILDHGHGQTFQAAWHRGVPGRLKLFGLLDIGVKVETTEQLEITAWRCTRCGYLKLYAPTHAPGSSDT